MKMGPLIILSGPSGVGKSTLAARLLAEDGLPLRRSVSATTRPRREGEVEGRDYRFVTPEWFQRQIDAGAFLEWAEVHGRRYGTPRSEVDDARRKGLGVLLVIDVQGAAQVRRKCPEALSIFLTLPREELYEQRLRGRGTESAADLAVRLEAIRREEARRGEYDHVVVNDDLAAAVAEVRGLIARRFAKGEPCSTN
jgi:guanylate kinase